jgi:thiosulfate/3-mercaptopyruvate sulfurtransferase
MANYQYPDAIVSTHWLAENLKDPSLRIFDCTVYLLAGDANSPYKVLSGRADYESGHIPGAAFADLQDDLSNQETELRFTMPDPATSAEQFAALGVGNDTRVVLYSRGNLQWATRIWWMLRSIGFDNAAVLDGGWERWEADNLPTETTSNTYPPAQLTAKPRAGLFCSKDEVLAAGKNNSATVINALSAELHAGHSPRYGRPGRIPGSVNVPATSLRDATELTLIDADNANAAFEAVDATPDKPTIIYCGGGIAATLDAFILHQLGHSQISVYDNSLNEWARDPSVQMESD